MASVTYNIYLASEGFYVLRSRVLAVLGCGDGCGHMWRTPQNHAKINNENNLIRNVDRNHAKISNGNN